jgi:DNA polymerase-3 subunit epsilon
MIKLLFVDTETTGLDPQKNGLTQISGVAQVRDAGFNVTKEKEAYAMFDYKLRPFSYDVIEESALQVCGLTIDDLDSPDRLPPKSAHDAFVEMMKQIVSPYDKTDKFFLVGYNATFDDRFLRAFFDKCGDKYYGSFISWPPIDVAQMAAILLGPRRMLMKSFKLSAVAETVGIKIDQEKLHDAMYDIELTIALFDWVVKSITQGASQ